MKSLLCYAPPAGWLEDPSKGSWYCGIPRSSLRPRACIAHRGGKRRPRSRVPLSKGERTMRRAIAGLLLMVLTGSSAACGDSRAATNDRGIPAELRVGIIPSVSPDEQKAHYEPLADYLSKSLDTEVELFTASDYAGVVEALASKRIDVAYLGGLTYAQAERQVKLTPMVTEIDPETSTRKYESAIVVRKNSDWHSVKELLGSNPTFAFGDVSSTSGSLYPRIMLIDAGAKCDAGEPTSCPPLSKVTFAGGHDAVAQAVAAGKVDAGGLEARILHRLQKEGSVPKDAFRTIGSRHVMGYPWAARSALGDEAIGEITKAFQTMDDPELLDLMHAKRYARVTADDYAEIRSSGKKLGLVSD
ncbi:MAG: phosphate/phosphite/phosphonate ABC transporter substrate-binding protein [Streptomyces sp.]|uniref:phosphate/phosphite/phosphonate ABC transporter substrate-binding protein n=1 Tax=Streptomyces sp. TaxID=1931 RepID=UPI003D69FE80